MSDDEDLFGSSGSDGDDTDDLIAASKSAPPVATKKKKLQKKAAPKRLQKKGATKRKRDPIPDADNDSDDDDDGPGLFDDSEDDEKPADKPLSKKERMEALRAKKRQESGASKPARTKKQKKEDGASGQEGEEKGYDSGDSYDSTQYIRTKEDNDFIDVDDDDPDAIKELYAEQTFDDERPDGSDDEAEEAGRKKKKKSSSGRARGPDALSDADREDDDNPIMAAVNKMKKKKRAVKKLSELEEEAKIFLNQMERAAEDDVKAVEERRPATKKLAMLPQVLDMLARRDMMRLLLEFDLLIFCKRWIQPLPNGSLGNVTVRQRLLEAVSNMTGEQGITSNDLKRSSFGKVVMTLYMHKSETPAMKRQLKTLIEQWSRPIFQKSGNMRDLEHVHASRREAGLRGISGQAAQQQAPLAAAAAARSSNEQPHDLHSIITSGSRGARDLGSNRVRVPFSKGFQYTVRPTGKTGNVADKRMAAGGGGAKDKRGNLSKRMLEKGRAVNKNQRSANISIEGRITK